MRTDGKRNCEICVPGSPHSRFVRYKCVHPARYAGDRLPGGAIHAGASAGEAQAARARTGAGGRAAAGVSS
jgi:hypothetical protein